MCFVVKSRALLTHHFLYFPVSLGAPRFSWLRLSNQPPMSTQSGHPSVVGKISTGQKLRLEVKAGMAHIWWLVKLYEPLYNTCHI